MGKSSPPLKHVCSLSLLCQIHLSEVGRHYHVFPKGTFKAQFAPPVIPRLVLQFLAKTPPTWTWTTRAGKSFNVPSVPTACSRDSPKVIQWIISIFHAFKAQLVPQAISQETGRVLPDYVKLYQNNMLMHFRSQQAQSMSIVEESTAHPDHPWLMPIIEHRHSPIFIQCIDSSMAPIYSHAMPNDVQQVAAVSYPKASPQYLGVDSNGDLRVSVQCLSEYVKILINLTEDDPQPPLSPLSSVSRGCPLADGGLSAHSHPTLLLSLSPSPLP